MSSRLVRITVGLLGLLLAACSVFGPFVYLWMMDDEKPSVSANAVPDGMRDDSGSNSMAAGG